MLGFDFQIEVRLPIYLNISRTTQDMEIQGAAGHHGVILSVNHLCIIIIIIIKVATNTFDLDWLESSTENKFFLDIADYIPYYYYYYYYYYY